MGIGFLSGAAAGAAGTAALNAATYLDMAVRGRAASSTPEKTIEAMETRLPVDVPGEGDTRQNRVSGIASLTGVLTGVGIGVAYGVLRRAGFRPPVPVGAVLTGVSVMGLTDLSMARLRVTDPRSWSATDWVSDLLPHLVYGAVTYATLAALDRNSQ
ncbi:hypothetical protein [Actinoplanes sp. TFC3]|uniref:hypothetical protein n=1 Tax=Actinoplanes sp. TFC3 TaxID=1710355 RepID=UPI00083170C0|nr:hypothetical protein [Actinoplanes sp. TFC3]